MSDEPEPLASWSFVVGEEPAQPTPPPNPTGQLGPYRLEAQVGEGGMGFVYAARGPAGRPVALKLLRGASSPERKARFLREGQLTAALRHPHIVTVHAAGEHRGLAYLAYELVTGETLQDLLRKGSLDREERIALFLQIVDAVAYAHAHGVVHRDLKPANVLVDASGRARVADFGLATTEDLNPLTLTGAIVGTPCYMPPESFSGELTRSPLLDVWALGVILYQLLTDQLPFQAENLLELTRRLAEADFERPRALDPTIPAAVEQVVLRALSANPAERHADAGMLQADLLAALDPSRSRSRSGLAPLGLALAALALLLAGLVVWSRAPAEGEAAQALPTATPSLPPPAQATWTEIAARLETGRREAAFVHRFARPGVRISDKAPARAERLARARSELTWVLFHAPHESALRRSAQIELMRLSSPLPAWPTNAEAERLYARKISRDSTTEQFMAYRDQVLKFDPHHPGVRVQNALVNLLSPQPLAAVRELVHAVALDPALLARRVIEAVRELGWGRNDGPSPLLPPSLLLRQLPAGDSDLLLRGFLCATHAEFARSDPDLLREGIRALSLHLEREPSEVLAWELRGRLLMWSGRLNAAASDLAVALEAEPSSGSALFARALLAAIRREVPETILSKFARARRAGYPPTGLDVLKRYPELRGYLSHAGFARRLQTALRSF